MISTAEVMKQKQKDRHREDTQGRKVMHGSGLYSCGVHCFIW